jgi:hypothetical protein
VTTKWTIPPRRSLKTIFAALRREPLRTQVRVVCSFATGCAIGLKTSAAARSSALNVLCSAGVGAAEDETEAEAEAEAEPADPDACVPELVLVAEALVLAVAFAMDDEADEAADVAGLVACASEDVAWLTVETAVETTEVGFGGGGGGGEDDVGSGTFVLVGSGTLVLVGSGTVVLVGSGTEVLVGSGTVVVVKREGGPRASAVGAAPAAAAAQSRTHLAHRPICGYNRRAGRTVALRRGFEMTPSVSTGRFRRTRG